MLSVAVMAHQRRKRLVDKLVVRLDAKPRVVWDQMNSVWDTGRRALLAYNPDATHHLVLQDDARIRRHLVAAVTRLLEHVPDDVPVSLYMGRWRHRPNRFPMSTVTDAAREHGASFAVFGGPWWGPAIILPTHQIEAVVEYGDRNPKRHANYDIRIAQYYATQNIPCWYSMPSIVGHQAGQSLVGRRGTRRHAQWFHDGPYDQLTWDGGHITPNDMRLPGRFPVTP